MRREYLSVDFSDLEHGLSVLFEASTAEHRKEIASKMLKDLESLSGATAFDETTAMLYTIAAFGDLPSPTLRDSFNSLVVAYSGWSADRLIAEKQSEESRAHGKKGGQPKSKFKTRDEKLIIEFNKTRNRSHSDSDAAQRMVNHHFTDSNGNYLSVSQIRRIVRNQRSKK
jgi:hypothetical protein